jgi:hypothetical protein
MQSVIRTEHTNGLDIVVSNDFQDPNKP